MYVFLLLSISWLVVAARIGSTDAQPAAEYDRPRFQALGYWFTQRLGPIYHRCSPTSLRSKSTQFVIINSSDSWKYSKSSERENVRVRFVQPEFQPQSHSEEPHAHAHQRTPLPLQTLPQVIRHQWEQGWPWETPHSGQVSADKGPFMAHLDAITARTVPRDFTDLNS